METVVSYESHASDETAKVLEEKKASRSFGKELNTI